MTRKFSFLSIIILLGSTLVGAYYDDSGKSPDVDTLVYLPIVHYDPCVPLPYNETIRFNIDKVNAPEVWSSCLSTGSGITVAILDTGVDLDHPDLQANVVAGKNFVADGSPPNDGNGHGSHVAGIVAARANNGGIIGVAPQAKIMPMKVLDNSGAGWDYDIADGITWAVNHGAQVLNLSLGSVYNSASISAAIDYARSSGALVIAAAGNCGNADFNYNGCAFQDQPFYPAALPTVIAVASTTASNGQSGFSTQGGYVEVSAPGSNIYSAYRGGQYITGSGTSQASPHVAGLAALIWSHNQTLTSGQVRATIKESATDLGTPGKDIKFGWGLINSLAALISTPMQVSADEWEQTYVAPNMLEAGDFAPGEIVIGLQSDTAIETVLLTAGLRAAGARVVASIPSVNVYKLAVPMGSEQAIVSDLSNVDGVAYAELNYRVYIAMR